MGMAQLSQTFSGSISPARGTEKRKGRNEHQRPTTSATATGTYGTGRQDQSLFKGGQWERALLRGSSKQALPNGRTGKRGLLFQLCHWPIREPRLPRSHLCKMQTMTSPHLPALLWGQGFTNWVGPNSVALGPYSFPDRWIIIPQQCSLQGRLWWCWHSGGWLQ